MLFKFVYQPNIFQMEFSNFTLQQTSSMLTDEEVHTGEPLGLLGVQKGCGTPDPHGAVIRGAGHEARQHRVPAHAVDRACVTRQLSYGQLAALVPDVHFVV